VEIGPDELAQLTDADIAAVYARDKWIDQSVANDRKGKQIPPPGDWTQLIFRSGRGFGKTKAQVEWAWWEGWRTGQPLIGHAVAPTLGDINGTLFEGPAGFRACVPAECLKGASWEQAFNKSTHILTLSCGTVIRGFGAQEEGGRLRGPQCHFAVGDELREWDRPAGNLEAVHTNMMFGLRLPYPDGSPSRAVMGTTPKAIPYLKALYKQPGVRVVEGSTYENLPNLNRAFLNVVLSKEGTKIGRAEIHAQDIGADEDGIFKKSWIRLWPPFKKLPEFTYILMSLDTAFEEENIDIKRQKEPDYSACSILGIFNTAQCFTEAERKKLNIKTKYAALLCDFWMERLSFPDLLEKTRQFYRTKWGQPGRRPDLVLIENKASGISLRQTLMTYGVPTWPFDPRGQSKTMRAHAASPLVMQGMLFMPESTRDERKGNVRDWAEPLVDQMTTFSGEGSIEFDDGLDTITQAMIKLMEMGYFHASPIQRGFPDIDEKEEAEQREAARQAAKEKGRVNPYAQ
jgi:predicted phage terminase large subunit-like protein